MNEIVTKTKTETSLSTDDKSVAISYLKNKEKFVEFYNSKEKNIVALNHSFTTSEITKILEKYINDIIKDDYLDCFSVDVIAKVCCKNFPKEYIKNTVGKDVEHFAINKFTDISGINFGKFSTKNIDKCIEYIKYNIDKKEESEFVEKLCCKLLVTPLFVSKDVFESCMEILVKNFHPNLFMDLFEIFTNISNFVKIDEIPERLVPDFIKKRNKVIQWVGKINKKLKDEKIIKDWRDEYYRYAGRSLKLLADDIDESYDFSNNLGYLKNIIEIIHNDKPNEIHLENFLCKTTPSIFNNPKNMQIVISNVVDLFDIYMLGMPKEENQKQLICNLFNNDKFSDEIKVDMMKKQLDKSHVYPEVKNKIANYFITYLKDSEINNELKENLQNHLISYICESAENSVLNEFLNTYENDVDKSKIVKHILDKLKNEHEKVIKLEFLVDFCFNPKHESMIGEAFIKDLITTLSFLNSNDDYVNRIIEYFSKVILNELISKELKEYIINNFYKNLDDNKKLEFIKTLYNNNNDTFENLDLLIGNYDNIRLIIGYSNGSERIKMISNLVNYLFKLETSDSYVTNFIDELIDEENTKDDKALFEKIVDALKSNYDFSTEIVTKSLINIIIDGSEEIKIKKYISDNFFEDLGSDSKKDFVTKLKSTNNNTLDNLGEPYTQYYAYILSADESVKKLKEYVDSNNPKEFINIFFESGSLSDDNKKEVINYFFSKLS